MKKLLLFSFFLLAASGLIAQPLQQYFDGDDTDPWNSVIIDLDTSSTNIWQVGMPQKQHFTSAATLPNAMLTDTVNSYPVNNTSIFSYKVEQMFLWGVTALQWKQKLDMDAGADGGLIEFSHDNGTTWHSVFNSPYVYNFYGYDSANVDTLQTGIVAFTGTDTTWRDIWLCFDQSWVFYHDNLLIRHTFISDSVHTGKDGWMIDNLLVHRTIIHTAVEDNRQPDYLKVYPNPAHDILFIEAQKLQEYHLIEQMDLIDVNGRVVDSWKHIPTKFFIRTRDYSNGHYLLRITTNIKTETVPVIINHD